MKSVHKALKLRHHKHTGKLLAHKHTSYRVLFLLMLAPIFMMALVGQLAQASDYMVTATVPASMPSGAPTITTPADGSTIKIADIEISGTCPVIDPAIIITIYDGTTFIGSGQCSVDGTFSVPVSLSVGTHTIVATVVTFTGQTGASSQPVTVIRSQTATPSAPSTPVAKSYTTPSIDLLAGLLYIVTPDKYVTIKSDGGAIWRGSFAGGTTPYTVRVEWGDGQTDTHTVADQKEQAFSHTYQHKQVYDIVIRVTDASGGTTTLHIIALTPYLPPGTIGDISGYQPMAPILAFAQAYMGQIYIGSLFALVFLWYLEHGRHLRWFAIGIGKGTGGPHRHR